MKQKDQSAQQMHAKITCAIWKNPSFKNKLMADPKAALKEIGINFKQANLPIKDLESWVSQLPALPISVPVLSERELFRMAQIEPPFTVMNCTKNNGC